MRRDYYYFHSGMSATDSIQTYEGNDDSDRPIMGAIDYEHLAKEIESTYNYQIEGVQVFKYEADAIKEFNKWNGETA